jgi:hypothetical protein
MAWLGSDPVAGFCQHGDETSGTIKACNFLTSRTVITVHEAPCSDCFLSSSERDASCTRNVPSPHPPAFRMSSEQLCIVTLISTRHWEKVFLAYSIHRSAVGLHIARTGSLLRHVSLRIYALYIVGCVTNLNRTERLWRHGRFGMGLDV